MNKKNLIGTVLLLVLIICLIFLAATLFKSEGEPNKTTEPELPVDNPAKDYILQETEDAGEEYINKIYFVGESTTSHFFKGGIERSHILVPSSATLTLGSDILQVLVGEKSLTIPEAVKDAEAEILIITIGVNNAANFTEKQFKTFYEKLITAIKEASPSTKIILQSSFPVTAEYSAQGHAVTNAAIDRNNEWTKEIAEENSLYYLDTQSILKDSNGALIESYGNGDGVHLNEKAYAEIIKYIRTHAIEIE